MFETFTARTVLWREGQMANLFDIPQEWRKRFAHLKEASLPGGHFFVDQFPHEVALTLREFLESTALEAFAD